MLRRFTAAWPRGLESQLQPARPFVEFVEWLEQNDNEKELAFWRNNLSGYCEPSSLARMRRAPSSKTNRVIKDLEQRQSDALAACAKREKLTLNTLIVGAWILLLSQRSRCNDVVTGVTVSGRGIDLPGIEQMAGMFINTLPLRMQVDPAMTVGEYLRAIQRSQLSIREHEQTPLVEIQKQSDLAPGAALFDSIVVFENFPSFDEATEAGAEFGRA